MLAEAYEDLKLLGNRKWISINCIDPWLLSMGATMLQPQFRYLPTFFIPPVGQGEVSDEEVKFFQAFFSLPDSGNPCPEENVVYVLNTGPDPRNSGNHFCTVAFMPSRAIIYIIRRIYKKIIRTMMTRTGKAGMDTISGPKCVGYSDGMRKN